MTINITINVTYEVEDEMQLRASAVASGGEENYNSGDAVMRLLRDGGQQLLTLPGTRVVGMGLGRGDYLNE